MKYAAKRTLLEINADITNCVDEETGEILDVARLDELVLELEDKIHGVALWNKEAKNDEAVLKKMKQDIDKRLKANRKLQEGQVAWLKNALNGKTAKWPDATVYYHPSSKVVIDCEPETLPDEFRKVTYEAKKAEIGEAIKAGATIAGCRIEDKSTLVVR